MSENICVNRKQLLPQEAISQGKCISTDLTRQVRGSNSDAVLWF